MNSASLKTTSVLEANECAIGSELGVSSDNVNYENVLVISV